MPKLPRLLKRANNAETTPASKPLSPFHTIPRISVRKDQQCQQIKKISRSRQANWSRRDVTMSNLNSMKASPRLPKQGGPEKLSSSSTRPIPEPSAHDQLLIKVKAAGVNRPDCIQRAGNYPPASRSFGHSGPRSRGRDRRRGQRNVTDWLKLGDSDCRTRLGRWLRRLLPRTRAGSAPAHSRTAGA